MRDARERAGLSPAAFAGAIGTSERAVQNWERRDNRPHPRFLKQMAELVPGLAAEIRKELEAYEWHPGGGRAPRGEMRIRLAGRKLKAETILEAHTALEIILEDGGSGEIQAIVRELERQADIARQSAESRPQRKK